MRTFFSSTFMEEKSLREVGIYYPIKLEYHKIINEQEKTKEVKTKFGIKVVKKSYKVGGTKVEEEKVEQVSNDEKEIEEILKMLERNEVTPVHLEEIMHDIMA